MVFCYGEVNEVTWMSLQEQQVVSYGSPEELSKFLQVRVCALASVWHHLVATVHSRLNIGRLVGMILDSVAHISKITAAILGISCFVGTM